MLLFALQNTEKLEFFRGIGPDRQQVLRGYLTRVNMVILPVNISRRAQGTYPRSVLEQE